MSRFLLPLLLSLASMAPAAQGTTVDASAPRVLPGETVVLLHGLGLGSWAMKRFEHALRREGYRVVNISYGSRWTPLEQLAGSWLPGMLHQTGADSAPRLHFVTHSMGGIVLRLWLQQQTVDRARAANPTITAITQPASSLRSIPFDRLGRIIMLAPPNSGSEVADHLRRFPPFRWFTGVNGARLGTGADSLPRSLGPWPADAGQLGVIAGNHSFNPLFSAWLPGPDDGKVAVASTRLAGMRDFLVLRHSHTWIQWRRETIRQTSAFLRDGHFSPAGKKVGRVIPNAPVRPR
jgi:pimeloyl-ACP methyl ester carboxylesterase